MPRPLLIIGHPGHELLVHDWMTQHRPMVMVLTDGSGSALSPRIADSLAVVTEAGGVAAPVFGHAPDSAFYTAILARDAGFFEPLVAAAEAAIALSGAQVVLHDAVEHFNPVHDLCAVVAGLACARSAAPPERWAFPIERPPAQPPSDWTVRRLDATAAERKRAAAARIPGLAAEVARLRVEQPQAGALELLMPLTSGAPLLPDPQGEPFYETFGRARVAAGVYGELITHVGHVAPLARMLQAQTARPTMTVGSV